MRVLLAALVGLLLLAACQPSIPDPVPASAAAPASAPAPSPLAILGSLPPAVLADPCRFLTADDLTAVFGKPVLKVGPVEVAGRAGCLYDLNNPLTEIALELSAVDDQGWQRHLDGHVGPDAEVAVPNVADAYVDVRGGTADARRGNVEFQLIAGPPGFATAEQLRTLIGQVVAHWPT